jgi:hypothetical protein
MLSAAVWRQVGVPRALEKDFVSSPACLADMEGRHGATPPSLFCRRRGGRKPDGRRREEAAHGAAIAEPPNPRSRYEVGVPLMDRSVHGIELTAAGRAFLDHARLALAQVEAAAAAARRAAHPEQRTLALGFLSGCIRSRISCRSFRECHAAPKGASCCRRRRRYPSRRLR